MGDFLLYLLALAVVQNMVLSTGLGSSVMLRMTRQPRDITLYCGLMCGFSVVSMLVFYPLKKYLLPDVFWVRLISPAVVVLLVIGIYLVTVLILQWRVPAVLARIQRILSLAVFNNLLIGLLLIAEFTMTTTLWGALGAAVGTSLGFLILSRLVEEALRRADNPDMPTAFKGFPIALLYLGLLALALSGFRPPVSLL
ncbi:MAG: hypothetical protein J6K98_01235 [Clostridia bacterium]|nr:hypothetical protein [Clostridia bacterium]